MEQEEGGLRAPGQQSCGRLHKQKMSKQKEHLSELALSVSNCLLEY